MNNGHNDWNVSYSRITFLEKLLRNHDNIEIISRHDDIVFEILRLKQKEKLTLLCCDEYVMGLTAVYRAIEEFKSPNIIFIGGNWNGYTKEAKDYCQQSKIGLYNASEINGGLWFDTFWSYYNKDSKGNPDYFYRAA